jgi:hypothetical protein
MHLHCPFEGSKSFYNTQELYTGIRHCVEEAKRRHIVDGSEAFIVYHIFPTRNWSHVHCHWRMFYRCRYLIPRHCCRLWTMMPHRMTPHPLNLPTSFSPFLNVPSFDCRPSSVSSRQALTSRDCMHTQFQNQTVVS